MESQILHQPGVDLLLGILTSEYLRDVLHVGQNYFSHGILETFSLSHVVIEPGAFAHVMIGIGAEKTAIRTRSLGCIGRRRARRVGLGVVQGAGKSLYHLLESLLFDLYQIQWHGRRRMPSRRRVCHSRGCRRDTGYCSG